MPTLNLKHFHCVDDTDESGGESPYFLTLVAEFAPVRATVRLTRRSYWNDKVDKADSVNDNWPVNVNIITGVPMSPSNTLVLSVMVEKDDGIDIKGAEVRDNNPSTADIQQQMQGALSAMVNAGFSATTPQAIDILKNTFRQAVLGALDSDSGGDDDLMETDSFRAVRQVFLTGTNGDLAPVNFHGDTGHYRAVYRQMP